MRLPNAAWSRRATLIPVATLIFWGCAVSAPASTPIVSITGDPAVTAPPASTAPTTSPASTMTPPDATAGRLDPDVPTACVSLGDGPCARARAAAAAALTADDQVVRYAQVGPFGCAVGDVCPKTLEARPAGDVTFEFADGTGITVLVKVAPDGTTTTTRAETAGIAVPPSSSPGLAPGANPFTLGHCGIWSGIDLDGSWWDPVGPVDVDSGDAVNATPGVIVATDPNHATFTAPTGFALRLQRRDGSKLLPFCM